MTNEIAIISEEDIKNKIYVIRGKEVMLDSDLAELYHCKNGTKTINQAVNRHRDRFPNDFYFELTEEETKNLWSQFGTANKMSRTLPNVFTEQGIYVLMTVLKGERAIEQRKMLIRLFKGMKDFIFNNNLIEQRYINSLVLKHDNKDDIKFICDICYGGINE